MNALRNIRPANDEKLPPIEAQWGSVVVINERLAHGRDIKACWGSTVVIVSDEWSDDVIADAVSAAHETARQYYISSERRILVER